MAKAFRAIGRYYTIFQAVAKYSFGTVISPGELRETLEKLGGSFLKFGQLASVRPDYFPEEYCRELFKLLDSVEPIEPALLDGIFLKEYGQRPESVFAKFERRPLAAASFGQVHEAWLAGGERLAVKVQRPFVAEDFFYDARLFRFLGWLIGRTGIVKTVDPAKLVREFVRWTEKEINYLQEAEHLNRLRDQLAKYDLPIKIPRVFVEYTTPKILAMEFIEGRTLKSYFLNSEAPPDFRRVFRDIIFFELHSFLFDGFFHADPHPANILISSSGQTSLIDAGIALEAGAHDRKTMARFFKEVVNENIDGTLKTFLEMVRTPVLELFNEARRNYPKHALRIQFVKNAILKRIKNGLNDLMTRWHKASREGGDLHDKSPMHKFMELFQLAERFGVKMPESSVFFARTFLSLDVAILELAPDFNIPQAVNDFFNKYPAELKKLEELPEDPPPYLRPGLSEEWSDILRSLDEELKAVEKELLSEKLGVIMERLGSK